MNSYLSQQFLDEDYKSFCPRENGSHLFFKEVGKHTVYKVVHPEHIEIYSIVRPRNKEKGKEEDFFEIIKLIPDYMDMRFFSLYHGSYKEELLCYKKAGTLLH